MTEQNKNSEEKKAIGIAAKVTGYAEYEFEDALNDLNIQAKGFQQMSKSFEDCQKAVIELKNSYANIQQEPEFKFVTRRERRKAERNKRKSK